MALGLKDPQDGKLLVLGDDFHPDFEEWVREMMEGDDVYRIATKETNTLRFIVRNVLHTVWEKTNAKRD